MKRYSAFGISIEADLDLPELLPVEADGIFMDLEIRSLKSSEDLPDFEKHGSLQSHTFQFHLNVKDVADFWIEDGKLIRYRRVKGVSDDTLRLFVLGSSLGCILQQRGFVVLHGNAVSTDGKTCKIIVGHRGAGKSTAAAWHYRQGDWILADDVCAITFGLNGIPMVIPSFPQIKLWQTSADLLGISTDGLRRIRSENEKFALPLGKQFFSTPLPLTEIIELQAENTVSTPIEGMDKTRCLIEHSYRYHFLKGMGLTSEYAKKLISLAGKVQIETGVRVSFSAKTGTPIA